MLQLMVLLMSLICNSVNGYVDVCGHCYPQSFWSLCLPEAMLVSIDQVAGEGHVDVWCP